MPWVATDAMSHTKKANTAKKQRQWAKVANSALASCLADGRSKDVCEASAIKQANAVVAESEEMTDAQLTLDSSETGGVSNLNSNIAWVPSDGLRTLTDEVIERLEKDLLEEITKTIAGKARPASDFLVVEDPQKPDSWHLPVKVSGKVDHRLMGGAWAALTKPKGFRGNKYEGPQKGSALKKLKALYKSEGLSTPSEMAAECGLDEFDFFALFGPPTMSFGDMIAVKEQNEKYQKITELASQFPTLAGNIMTFAEESKRWSGLRGLCDEFAELTRDILGEEKRAPGEEETTEEEFTENAVATVLEFVGEEKIEEGGRRGPLTLELALINPGWGNSKDNNYYPAEVLKRDAHVFEGVKMYATNHKEDEKNVKTEVAVIKKVSRFLDDGTPVGLTVIHDPDFAEATRNRNEAGTLETLECSINGFGKTKRGEVDGKKGKIVETLTRMASVDWVTRAGAGGHALNIMESEEEAMPNKEEREETQEEHLDATPKPEKLDSETVETILSNSRLPEVAREELRKESYTDVSALNEAITEEVDYVKKLTRSGKPHDMGESSGTSVSPIDREKELEEGYDRIFERYGG